MLTILAVGEDYDLLQTRAEVLRQTGANVLCSSGAAALKYLAEWEFDLVVLGHSVQQWDAERISVAAHRQGSKTLVLLAISNLTQEYDYDGIVIDGKSFVDEPGCLVRSATQLLKRQQNVRPSGKPLKTPTKLSPQIKKRPASLPSDISARRAQLIRFETRKAG